MSERRAKNVGMAGRGSGSYAAGASVFVYHCVPVSMPVSFPSSGLVLTIMFFGRLFFALSSLRITFFPAYVQGSPCWALNL